MACMQTLNEITVESKLFMGDQCLWISLVAVTHEFKSPWTLKCAYIRHSWFIYLNEICKLPKITSPMNLSNFDSPWTLIKTKKWWCHSSLYKFVYSIALTRFVLNCFKLNCRRQRKVFKIHSLRKEKVSRKKEGCGWTYKKEKRWTISEFCSVNLQFSNILLCSSIKKILVIDLNNLFKVLMTTVLGWNRSIK